MKWLKVWLLTPILLIVGLSTNEMLLHAAKHEPSLVNDADLFCNIYSHIQNLNQSDIVLLGASRMQTGFDLDVLRQQFPGRKALLLAQSGGGTSYPVFKDIVENTTFNGIIIIDENERTLISTNDNQKQFIEHCRTSFSLNQKINRNISTLLQSNFTFVNPQSSSLRLWGNLVAKQQPPEPFYTKTLPDRQQLTDYARANIHALKDLHQRRFNGVKQAANQPFPNSEEWLKQTNHWKATVQQFQARGGKVIFVRMPVSTERWEIERQLTPVDKYWEVFEKQLNVPSIHFANHADLSSFELPDTSHLDVRDRGTFTQALLKHLHHELSTSTIDH